MVALRGDISFRYLKQFFLVESKTTIWIEKKNNKQTCTDWLPIKNITHCNKKMNENYKRGHNPNIIDLSQKTSVMVRTKKYYLKNNYLTLRSKIKVP
jgi:hypothetical protein